MSDHCESANVEHSKSVMTQYTESTGITADIIIQSRGRANNTVTLADIDRYVEEVLMESNIHYGSNPTVRTPQLVNEELIDNTVYVEEYNTAPSEHVLSETIQSNISVTLNDCIVNPKNIPVEATNNELQPKKKSIVRRRRKRNCKVTQIPKPEVPTSRKRSRRPTLVEDHTTSHCRKPDKEEAAMDDYVSPMDFLEIETSETPRNQKSNSKSYVFTALIEEALMNSKDGCLTTGEIREYISKTHPHFNLDNDRKSRSILQDCLSRKSQFISLKIKNGDRINGWKLDETYQSAVGGMMVNGEMFNVGDYSDNETQPSQCLVDATMVDESNVVPDELSQSSDDAIEISDSVKNNPIELEDSADDSPIPEVVNCCSSSPSSFAIEEAIESISQQEHRVSPATDMSSEQSSSTLEAEIDIEEKVITFPESVTDEQESIECPLCGQLFSSNESLGAHMSVHRKRPRLSQPQITTVTNSLAVTSTSNPPNGVVANAPAVTSSNNNDNHQNSERVRQTLNSLPAGLLSGQRPIIFLGNVYFNTS